MIRRRWIPALVVLAASAGSTASAEPPLRPIPVVVEGPAEAPSPGAASPPALEAFPQADLSAARSVTAFIDEVGVVGRGGDPIGDVEDLLVGADGRIVALVAEVGGLSEIGDIHVSIPWERVERPGAVDAVRVPLAADDVPLVAIPNGQGLTRARAAAEIVREVDEGATGEDLSRASELVGVLARFRTDEHRFERYGFVVDLLMRDGAVAAVLVEPDEDLGIRGPQAFPFLAFHGSFGWFPDREYHDLPWPLEALARHPAHVLPGAR